MENYGVELDGHMLTVTLERASKEWLRQMGREIKARARVLCPVGTGALKRSISVRMVRDGKGVQVVAGHKKGKGPVFYAHMVEFGTRRARAHPFLRPALEAVRLRAMGKLRDIAERDLR